MININEDEKEALREYQETILYKTMNAMLFPGIENELARIFDDNQEMNIEYILHAEKLLKVQEDLYSLMYKYGKTLKKAEHTMRMDREVSIPEMKKRKEIVSNFSTTKDREMIEDFTKRNMVIMDIDIEPNATCVDINEVLKEKVKYSWEEEILIAPFSPIEIREIEFDQKDFEIENEDKDIAVEKLKIIVKPLPKPKKLTPEEKEDKEKMLKIFKDENMRKVVVSVLLSLYEMQADGTTKEEAIKEITSEEKETYSKWKEAYQKILRYDMREIELKINNEIEDKEARKKIEEKELIDMVEKCPYEKLEKVISQIKRMEQNKEKRVKSKEERNYGKNYK